MLDAAILFMDGKRHRSYRKLVQPSFVPGRAVWWLDNWIRHRRHALIDGLSRQRRRHADLNAEFCAPIPLLTITGSFGVTIEEALDVRAAVTSDGKDTANPRAAADPDDRRPPRGAVRRSDQRARPGRDRPTRTASCIGSATRKCWGSLSCCWRRDRARRGSRWDLTIVALLRHPQALAAAREDRAFLRGVVEESLRWMPTDPVFSRFVARDCTLGGVDLPAGAVIHACLAAANRDTSRWERPDEFDPFRPLKAHLGFGFGPHTCLGAHVARMEITHGVGALLDRLPGLRLDPDRPAPRVIGLYERGPDTVPVAFGRAS